MKKVKETCILIDQPKREKPKAMRTPEDIAAVSESVRETSSTIVRRRSQQLNISETSFRRILRKDLCIMPYKFQLVQELKPIDYPNRLRITEEANFGKKTYFQIKLILILADM